MAKVHRGAHRRSTRVTNASPPACAHLGNPFQRSAMSMTCAQGSAHVRYKIAPRRVMSRDRRISMLTF